MSLCHDKNPVHGPESHGANRWQPFHQGQVSTRRGSVQQVLRFALSWISRCTLMRIFKMMAFFVNAAIAFAVCTNSVLAQDSSADRQEAAARYMSVVSMSNTMDDIIVELAKQLPQDKREEFIDKMKQIVRMDVLERITLESIVRIFTTDELNAMTDFYGSTLGRSIKQKTGIYAGQVIPLVQAEIQQAVQQLSRQK